MFSIIHFAEIICIFTKAFVTYVVDTCPHLTQHRIYYHLLCYFLSVKRQYFSKFFQLQFSKLKAPLAALHSQQECFSCFVECWCNRLVATQQGLKFCLIDLGCFFNDHLSQGVRLFFLTAAKQHAFLRALHIALQNHWCQRIFLFINVGKEQIHCFLLMELAQNRYSILC